MGGDVGPQHPVQHRHRQRVGLGPANQKSCALTKNTNHCAVFHAEETDFWSNVYYWTTPVENCVDGRTDVKCVPYDEWVRTWSELRST